MDWIEPLLLGILEWWNPLNCGLGPWKGHDALRADLACRTADSSGIRNNIVVWTMGKDFAVDMEDH